MGPVNKLSLYTVRYRCYDDCEMSGCPTHEATFEYGSASNTFCITFAGERTCYDSTQFRLIQDFIESLNANDATPLDDPTPPEGD